MASFNYGELRIPSPQNLATAVVSGMTGDDGVKGMLDHHSPLFYEKNKLTNVEKSIF